MPKYKIEFLEDATQKLAHGKDAKRGGFREVTIPKGTIMEVKDASLLHWQARGKIKLLGRVPDRPLAGFGAQPPVGKEPQLEQQPISKKALREKLHEAAEAFDAADLSTGTKLVAELDTEAAKEHLEEILADDSFTVFFAGVDDAKTGTINQPQEFLEALKDAEDALQPPSRRKRNSVRTS